MRTLRDYQVEAVEAVRAQHADGVGRTAVVLPTGTGKTSVIAQLCIDTVAAGRRAVVIAHRSELLGQVKNSVTAFGSIYAGQTGIVQASQNEVTAPIVAGMVQTLVSPGRAEQLGNVGLVVVDECHRSAANSYQSVLGRLGSFDGIPTVGFTATLSRGDTKALGDTWESVAYTKSVKWFIDRDYLVTPHGKSVVVEGMDLSGVSTSKGDYADGELGEVVATYATDIARAWKTYASDRKTMVFVPSIEAAGEVALALAREGARVKTIVGSNTTAERTDIYERFHTGEINTLVSVNVLTEGFDEPTVDCVLMARPTKLAHVYIQCVGRGLRPSPDTGKKDCLVLDVVGVSRIHSLALLPDLGIGGAYETVGTDGPLDEQLAEAVEQEEKAAKIRGVEVLDDVDLFAQSQNLWLHTKRGVRFIPAADEVVFLWPSEEGEELHRVGHINVKIGPRVGGFLDNGLSMDLETAKTVAEEYAVLHGANLSKRNASWRRGNTQPSEAQVRFARGLRIANADTFSKAALSDAISVALASRKLDI